MTKQTASPAATAEGRIPPGPTQNSTRQTRQPHGPAGEVMEPTSPAWVGCCDRTGPERRNPCLWQVSQSRQHRISSTNRSGSAHRFLRSPISLVVLQHLSHTVNHSDDVAKQNNWLLATEIPNSKMASAPQIKFMTGRWTTVISRLGQAVIVLFVIEVC